MRSASYWKISRSHYVWFDNGWNFFDENWKNLGAVGWSAPFFGGTPQKKGRWNISYENPSAFFSGDPTNTKEMQGRACQMIDLYLDRLKADGVRFAVWNILAYSKIPFSDAEELSILYSDKDVSLQGDKAFVFRPENKENNYTRVGINSLLG